MSIKINIPSHLRHLANGQSVAEVNGNTVGECLHDLVRQFPNIKIGLFDTKGGLLVWYDIYINQESSYPEQLATLVKDGDELHLVILHAGG